jgi:hypothetical protein
VGIFLHVFPEIPKPTATMPPFPRAPQQTTPYGAHCEHLSALWSSWRLATEVLLDNCCEHL